ncbi:MAG TPA: hypothetical protein VGD98_23400 [Ktedonobacteraceae bacterium]
MHLNGQDPINKMSGGDVMETSEQQEQQVSEKEQWRQAATIAATAPEREMPTKIQPLEEDSEEGERGERGESAELAEQNRLQFELDNYADAELTIMLKQIGTYFIKEARDHDLEAISFSLRHLFSRVDFLYRQALPDLESWTMHEPVEKSRETFLHQQIWLHLQTVNRTLDRMAPLCHLLSDVIECLLDTLDNEEVWLRTFEEEETRLLEIQDPTKKMEVPGIPRLAKSVSELVSSDSESWERSVSTLMDRLLVWQEQHHKLASFRQQLSQAALSSSSPNELDTAFAILLDSAGAIFGDILPNFRTVGPEDKEEISALLFDLMQQSDQMLVQFEVTLEPLTSLLRHFAAASENG